MTRNEWGRVSSDDPMRVVAYAVAALALFVEIVPALGHFPPADHKGANRPHRAGETGPSVTPAVRAANPGHDDHMTVCVTPRLRVICARRQHRAPRALAPWIIRWGAKASSDFLRR